MNFLRRRKIKFKDFVSRFPFLFLFSPPPTLLFCTICKLIQCSMKRARINEAITPRVLQKKKRKKNRKKEEENTNGKKYKEGSRQADSAVINSKKGKWNKKQPAQKQTFMQRNGNRDKFLCFSCFFPAAFASGREIYTDRSLCLCLSGCLFKRQLPAAKMIVCTFGGKLVSLWWQEVFCCISPLQPCNIINPLSALPFPLPLPLAIKPCNQKGPCSPNVLRN